MLILVLTLSSVFYNTHPKRIPQQLKQICQLVAYPSHYLAYRITLMLKRCVSLFTLTLSSVASNTHARKVCQLVAHPECVVVQLSIPPAVTQAPQRPASAGAELRARAAESRAQQATAGTAQHSAAQRAQDLPQPQQVRHNKKGSLHSLPDLCCCCCCCSCCMFLLSLPIPAAM